MSRSLDLEVGPGFHQMELPDWDSRSWVTASMLNPALVALSIASSAYEYARRTGDGLPWELAFLSVPMALHRDTRKELPSRVNSHPSNWLAEHAVIQAGLPARARSLAPYVREGLRYGLGTGSLTLDENGGLEGQVVGKVDRKRDPELAAIVGTSAFLGRWFAAIGSPATIYALFGVAP